MGLDGGSPWGYNADSEEEVGGPWEAPCIIEYFLIFQCYIYENLVAHTSIYGIGENAQTLLYLHKFNPAPSPVRNIKQWCKKRRKANDSIRDGTAWLRIAEGTQIGLKPLTMSSRELVVSYKLSQWKEALFGAALYYTNRQVFAVWYTAQFNTGARQCQLKAL